jgi:hypothetical protein
MRKNHVSSPTPPPRSCRRLPRGGAITYNAVHTYVGPLILGGYALFTGKHLPLLVALICVGHIGFDRMLGFGLKYPSRFKDTHLDPERHRVGSLG